MTRRIVPLLVIAAVALAGTPADAAKRKPKPKPKPKPIVQSWDVTLPVPNLAWEGDSHCGEGVDNVSRATKAVTVGGAGDMTVPLSGFLGDWVVEIFDAKGRVLAYGAELSLTGEERVAKWKKKRAGKENVVVAVCNYGGTPRAHVDLKFVYA